MIEGKKLRYPEENPVKHDGIMMPMIRDQSGMMGTGATGKGSGSERAKGNGRDKRRA